MFAQSLPDHTWSDRLRESAENVGAMLVLLGLIWRIFRVHVDRYVARVIANWFKRNHAEDLEKLKQLPDAIEKLTRATRSSARAQREHTKSMSSFSERIARVEARLDERSST